MACVKMLVPLRSATPHLLFVDDELALRSLMVETARRATPSFRANWMPVSIRPARPLFPSQIRAVLRLCVPAPG